MKNKLQEYMNKYPNMFDEHIAKRINLNNGNDCIIKFAKPDTRELNITFVYVDGYFHIQGDYGCASFTWWNPNNTIETMAKFAENVGYFISKCRASRTSEVNSHFINWDADKCIQEVKERLECDLDEELDYEVSDWEEYTESQTEWSSFLNRYGENLLGPDHWEWSHSAGHVVDNSIYFMVYGLKESLKQLENKDKSC